MDTQHHEYATLSDVVRPNASHVADIVPSNTSHVAMKPL